VENFAEFIFVDHQFLFILFIAEANYISVLSLLSAPFNEQPAKLKNI